MHWGLLFGLPPAAVKDPAFLADMYKISPKSRPNSIVPPLLIQITVHLSIMAPMGFALSDKCVNVTYAIEQDGVAAAAKLILESNRNDWVYITTGPTTTSARALKQRFPNAAENIDVVFVMGSNLCDQYKPYFGVPAPVAERNTACVRNRVRQVP
jgi:inosine-uridine nucleoside N-ribohydrolase